MKFLNFVQPESYTVLDYYYYTPNKQSTNTVGVDLSLCTQKSYSHPAKQAVLISTDKEYLFRAVTMSTFAYLLANNRTVIEFKYYSNVGLSHY